MNGPPTTSDEVSTQQLLSYDWTTSFNSMDSMIYYYAAIGVLSAMLLVYWTLDLHYFTRMGLVYISSRFIKKKAHILDQTTVSGKFLFPYYFI